MSGSVIPSQTGASLEPPTKHRRKTSTRIQAGTQRKAEIAASPKKLFFSAFFAFFAVE
jgi:hypothetical protein